MAYNKKTWIVFGNENATPLNVPALNDFESRIAAAFDELKIENKTFNYKMECGLELHFIKHDKTVTCFVDGTIEKLNADVDQTIIIDNSLKPIYVFREAKIIDETGIIGYIAINNSVVTFRTKTSISSPRYSRFVITYPV